MTVPSGGGATYRNGSGGGARPSIDEQLRATEAALAERTAQLEIATEQLRVVRAEAASANLANVEFLSAMSHQLRSPMNAILGFAQILEMDPEARDRESIEQILRAGSELLELIGRIFDLSRIDVQRPSDVAEFLELIDGAPDGPRGRF